MKATYWLLLTILFFLVGFISVWSVFELEFLDSFRGLWHEDHLNPVDVIVDDPNNVLVRKQITKIMLNAKNGSNISEKLPTSKSSSERNGIVVETDNNSDKHKPFNFFIGMDRIRHEYSKEISLLKPIYTKLDKPPTNSKCKHRGKVFALGIMKTGTTSMVQALHQLGYKCTHDSCIHLGNWFHFIDTVHLWQPFEVIILSLLNTTDLLHDMYIKESKNGLSFGDSPWCFMYPIMDKWYPNSKYILMTRKDDQTYVNSYLRYLKKFGKKHVNKGLSNDEFALIALRRYHLHNQRVRKYFENRPNDLLEIAVDDVSDPWTPIANFLGCNAPKRGFPHENKSNRGRINRMNRNNIKLSDPDNTKWDWYNKWDANGKIPYLIRKRDESHQLIIVDKDEFVFDWNVFLVTDLRVKNSLSSVQVQRI